jgi:hypothetical protein
MEQRIMQRVESQGKVLDMHIDSHRERDTRIQNSVDELKLGLHRMELDMVKSNAFTELQTDMKKMEKLVTRIHTILEVRDSRDRTVGRTE